MAKAYTCQRHYIPQVQHCNPDNLGKYLSEAVRIACAALHVQQFNPKP